MNIYENNAAISLNILNTDESVLRETWRVGKIDDDRIGQWIDYVASVCSLKNYNATYVLNVIFNRK